MASTGVEGSIAGCEQIVRVRPPLSSTRPVVGALRLAAAGGEVRLTWTHPPRRWRDLRTVRLVLLRGAEPVGRVALDVRRGRVRGDARLARLVRRGRRVEARLALAPEGRRRRPGGRRGDRRPRAPAGRARHGPDRGGAMSILATSKADVWVDQRGSGPAVLLLAGLGDPHDVWQPPARRPCSPLPRHRPRQPRRRPHADAGRRRLHPRDGRRRRRPSCASSASSARTWPASRWAA